MADLICVMHEGRIVQQGSGYDLYHQPASRFVADGALTAVVLPLCIVVIMIAMGATLTGADFQRVLAKPKEVAVGVGAQMMLLPAM